jgi:hypothetical protein
VGAAIQDRGGIDLPILAYFAVFWMIWKKEESYSTRFDTTDISSHLTTLSVCFALLGGSLSAYSTFDSGGCTRIMGVAGFSALLHVVLHVRVFFWFKDVDDATGDAVAESVNSSVKRYAVFNSVVNTIETITWGIGMLLPSGSDWRKWTFLLGVVLNMRIPGMIMPNDFHGELSNEWRPVMLVCFYRASRACYSARNPNTTWPMNLTPTFRLESHPPHPSFFIYSQPLAPNAASYSSSSLDSTSRAY